MELNVPVNDEHLEELRLSNTQSPATDYTAMVVGHFLRKLYTDMLEEEFPERLQPLIDKLDASRAGAWQSDKGMRFDEPPRSQSIRALPRTRRCQGRGRSVHPRGSLAQLNARL